MLRSPVHAVRNIPEDNFWITNDLVYAIEDDGNGTVYLGGDFNFVGPNTGHGAALDASTGNVDMAFPLVEGTIYSVISDGSGGWYIGGSFTKVGSLWRSRLAHILSDKTVDPDFNPGANNTVDCMTISGSTLYVGGLFTTAGGQSRNRIAAIDLTTGVATSWNPNSNGEVRTLVVSGSAAYAGGEFTSIGGESRNSIAALDLTTGLATTWDPDSSSGVRALVISGSTVYAGGTFSTIGGQSRSCIAALDITTGLATAWNPNASSWVSTMALSGSTMYVGGGFTTIGGQSRNRIAALDTTTGLATAWNPNAGGSVSTIAVSGSVVYAGGYFTSIGGETRYRLAALDATTGNATAWTSDAESFVFSIAISGSTVYVGGSFISIDGMARSNMAAFDTVTGTATSWNPTANGRVSSIEISGSTMYVAGGFTSIGGELRSYLAALDVSTGLATAWNPSPNNMVNAIDVSGSLIYAGGTFSTIGGASRTQIAAIDLSTGLATAWNPSCTGIGFPFPECIIGALEVSGSTVYAGGDYIEIGGQGRNGLAAIDSTTGLATSWNPNPSGGVRTIDVSGSLVYVSGSFSSIGGQSRNKVAALSASTGLATEWDPDSNGNVYDLDIDDPLVYLGGEFTDIGGESRRRIASVNISSGLASPWDPNEGTLNPDDVQTISGSDSYVFASGDFDDLGNYWRPHFAVYGLDSTAPIISLTPISPEIDSDPTPSLSGTASEPDGPWISEVEYQIDTTSGVWKACSPDDGAFDEDSESFTCNVSPALSDGVHTIYVRTTNSDNSVTAGGNESTDVFTVDTTGPSGSIVINNGAFETNDPNMTLTLSASDQYSSVEDMMISQSPTFFGSTWEGYKKVKEITLNGDDGYRYVYVKYRDDLGNISATSVDGITLDTTTFITITEIDNYEYTPIRWMVHRRPVFEGQTEAFSDVHVEINAIGLSDWTVADASGNWSWQAENNLPLGILNVSVTGMDSAGNSDSADVVLVILSSFTGGGGDSTKDDETDDNDEEDDDGDDVYVDDGGISDDPDSSTEVGHDKDEIEEDGYNTAFLGDLLILGSEIVDSSISSVTDSIKEVNMSPTGQVSSASIITIAALSGSVDVAVVTGTSFVHIPLLFSQVFLGGIFGLSKRRKPWGTVYDSATKEPLSRAVVRVLRDGNLIVTTVTDTYGVFTVDLEPGTYELKAQKGAYIFPTQLIVGDSDGGRTPIYRGGQIMAPEEKSTVEMYVPMDPVGMNDEGRISVHVRSLGSKLLGWGAVALMVLGTVFSLWSFLVVGGFIYLVLIIISLVLLLFNLYIRVKTPDKWGKVVTEDGDPVAGLEIGLYDYPYDRLIDTRITDEDGRYRFIVSGDTYWIRPTGIEYVLTHYTGKGGIEVGRETDKELVLAKKITVNKTVLNGMANRE